MSFDRNLYAFILYTVSTTVHKSLPHPQKRTEPIFLVKTWMFETKIKLLISLGLCWNQCRNIEKTSYFPFWSSPVSIPWVLGLFCDKTCMFLNPPSLPELRMWAQVKCSHRKPSSASIGRLHDLQISFEDHESGRRYRCLPFPLYSYLLYDLNTLIRVSYSS